MCFVVFAEETSGSEEENMHYYSPAADLGFRSRKKKKPKAHSKNSQSLFSVNLSVNHGLMCLHANAKVTFSIFHTQALLWLAGQIYLTSEFYFINNIHHWFKSGQSPHSSFKSSVAANQPAGPLPLCLSLKTAWTGCCCGSPQYLQQLDQT